MEEEVPQYFLCPISLQIMKDPVTAITGITYERESIEKWLRRSSRGRNATCPVTNQPLPRDADLTPNHMLRKLIQAWCTNKAGNGVNPIPTPKPPLDKILVRKLVKDIEQCSEKGSDGLVSGLEKMEGLAMEDERNRTCMAELGVAKVMAVVIIRCVKEENIVIKGIGEALRVLYLVCGSADSSLPNQDIKSFVKENHDFVDSLTWILLNYGEERENHVVVKTQAMLVLQKAMKVASPVLLERLNPSFFEGGVKVIKEKISQQATKSALQTLIDVCPWGRNRMKIVEANGVCELIEYELEKPEKNMSELAFDLMAKLCSCADGREQLLKHAGSIAMISKRILRVSQATDDRALHILSLISKFSATDEVVHEMLRVGAVSKLCMVVQADCATYLKQKARGILRLHSNVWNNSPCIAVYLLTRYPR